MISDSVVNAWRRYHERKVTEALVVLKLYELREDPVDDQSLFLVPAPEKPDAEVGEEFTIDDRQYRVEHIEFGYLFVREL